MNHSKIPIWAWDLYVRADWRTTASSRKEYVLRVYGYEIDFTNIRVVIVDERKYMLATLKYGAAEALDE